MCNVETLQTVAELRVRVFNIGIREVPGTGVGPETSYHD
jgi:hypothetical protein